MGPYLTCATFPALCALVWICWFLGWGVRAKILLNLWSVWMKGSPNILVLEVHSVSHYAGGIFPSSTPCLTCFSVSIVCGGWSSFSLRAIEVQLCGCYRHFVLSLSWWCWESRGYIRKVSVHLVQKYFPHDCSTDSISCSEQKKIGIWWKQYQNETATI